MSTSQTDGITFESFLEWLQKEFPGEKVCLSRQMWTAGRGEGWGFFLAGHTSLDGHYIAARSLSELVLKVIEFLETRNWVLPDDDIGLDAEMFAVELEGNL